MSMIERVASALKRLVNDNWDKGEITTHEQAARAAIKAMREPTDAMIDAVRLQHYAVEHYDGSGHHRKFPTLGSGHAQVWTDMIDAALAGSDGGKQQAYVDESWSW